MELAAPTYYYFKCIIRFVNGVTFVKPCFTFAKNTHMDTHTAYEDELDYQRRLMENVNGAVIRLIP